MDFIFKLLLFVLNRIGNSLQTMLERVCQFGWGFYSVAKVQYFWDNWRKRSDFFQVNSRDWLIVQLVYQMNNSFKNTVLVEKRGNKNVLVVQDLSGVVDFHNKFFIFLSIHEALRLLFLYNDSREPRFYRQEWFAIGKGIQSFWVIWEQHGCEFIPQSLRQDFFDADIHVPVCFATHYLLHSFH